jgi:transcriptional regulator with XRE-family HTH domain
MKELGIQWNRTTVAKLETGRRESVSVQELLALALVLDVPPISLLADPSADELIPLADGIEVDPWSALLWMSGAGTLDAEPDHVQYHAAADLIYDGRLVAGMATELRRIPRVWGAETEEETQRRRDDLDRSHLEAMRNALNRIRARGVKPPQVGEHILKRAEELGVLLPGQKDE